MEGIAESAGEQTKEFHVYVENKSDGKYIVRAKTEEEAKTLVQRSLDLGSADEDLEYEHVDVGTCELTGEVISY